jgi:rod shape-determining protein MreC
MAGLRFALPFAFVLLLTFSLIVADSRKTTLAGTLRNGLATIIAPLQDVLNAPFQWAAGRINATTDFFTTYQQNRFLKEQVATLEQWRHETRRMALENQALKMESRFLPAPGTTFLTAHVANIQSSPFSKTLRTTTSRDDKVVPGMIATHQGAVLGRVVRTSPGSAVVVLAQDPNARIPVRIRSGEQTVNAIASGNGREWLRLDYVPEGISLKDGAWVETSGIGGFFPAGLPVGTITRHSDGQGITLFARYRQVQTVTLALYP